MRYRIPIFLAALGLAACSTPSAQPTPGDESVWPTPDSHLITSTGPSRKPAK